MRGEQWMLASDLISKDGRDARLFSCTDTPSGRGAEPVGFGDLARRIGACRRRAGLRPLNGPNQPSLIPFKPMPILSEVNIGESALLTDLAMCVNYYRLSSPGLFCCVGASLELDADTQMRPDLLVMVNSGAHKQCAPSAGYDRFVGPPNFILDVFPENDWRDYEERRDVYEKAGVREYVAVRDTESVSWVWNRLVDGWFESVGTDTDGMIRSSALPGLWIPTDALKRRDWWSVLSAIAQGVTRVEHHDFMDTIWKAGRRKRRLGSDA